MIDFIKLIAYCTIGVFVNLFNSIKCYINYKATNKITDYQEYKAYLGELEACLLFAILFYGGIGFFIYLGFRILS